jgi:hypothetical protein
MLFNCMTLQVRLQTQNFRNPQYKGAVDCFTSILKKESVRQILLYD